MIAVAGSGAFGTALAISLAQNTDAILWARNPETAAQMQESRENAQRLPGARLPKAITVTADFGSISAEIPVLLAVPMQQLRSTIATLGKGLENRPLVACCKGVELSTGLGPTAILSEVAGATPAILTGPSFAADIAQGLPTALTPPTLRLYRTTDTTGAELGGALKNVIAIAAGVVMGAGLGDSARAALMTRGFAEMTRMAHALGARPETLTGLSGFGDLVLTCTSEQSRNFRFGMSLGRADAFDPTITVEGAATARAVIGRATALGLEMPVTAAVVALLDGRASVSDAMAMLLSRPLKEE